AVPGASSPLSEFPAPRALHSFPTRRSSDLVDRLSLGPDAQARDPGLGSRPDGGRLSGYCRRYMSQQGASATSARPCSDGAKCSADRKSTRLNSSHVKISYAVFCLKKKKSTA